MRYERCDANSEKPPIETYAVLVRTDDFFFAPESTQDTSAVVFPAKFV